MNEDKDKKAPDEGEERTVFMPSLPDAAPAAPPGGEPKDEASGSSETAPQAPSPATPDVPELPPESPFRIDPVTPAGQEAPAAADPEPAAEASPFAPTGAEPVPAPPAPPPPPAEEPRTQIAPAGEAPAAAEPDASPPTASPAPGAPAPPVTAGLSNFIPREAARSIKVGDVLNSIFEVKRFIARGGMGEVFEGTNVNTDERVAIKVMLPAMAADEKVVAMFRKEARTLTKLQHEALVSYRVLAQEPQLGVLYIVTEFIEGVELCDMLGKVERTPDELAGLLRRLASGLAAAHRLGAIHRDISPDNVLLPGGDVHQATIIDFGIAKDLDASSATIVGDGFAGKLNYVAPEQLGDFGREVGPWTDVYSLALVILAVAQGKNVNMSGSLVDAIDKRRKGPDLTPVPGDLRPLLEAMLRPDPKERIRSMEEVIAALGGQAIAPPPPPPPLSVDAPAATGSGPPRALLFGGVVAAALAVGVGAWYMMSPTQLEIVPANNSVVAPPLPPGDPVETARRTVNSVLPSVGCTWLDIGSINNGDDGVRVAMRGVAGDSDAAQREITRALGDAGLRNPRIGFGDVAPITPAGCAALDTYRQVRASSNYKLSVAQPRFEMVRQPPGLPYAGEDAANAVIRFDFSNSQSDFAILAIEPSGAIATLVPNRAAFQSALAGSTDGRPIADEGNGRYRLSIDLDHQGWSGIILITGEGPFDTDLIAPRFGARGPSWQGEFLSTASQRNWRVEMAWFESVNRVIGDRLTVPGKAP